MTQVTIIIIAFNEQATIAATIASIQAMDQFPADHQILIVDDGSTDATADTVRAAAAGDPRVQVLTQPNSGRGAARAAGVEAATGALIGFVDADITLPAHWWTVCQAALADADAVGGIAVPDGDVSFVHRVFGLVPKVRPHTTTVSGGNGLFKRAVFDAIGFDPALRNGEDVVFNQQLTAAGFRALTVPGLLVDHHETKTFTTSCRWLYESGIGATAQWRRDRTWRLPDLVAAGFVGAVALSAVAARRTPAGCLLAPGYVLAASAAHLVTKFDLPRTPVRSVGAIAAHTPLMGCYLLGRIRGTLTGPKPSRG